MSKLIKIYGERNTSTNYLSRIIQLNLDIVQLSGVVPPYISRLQKLFLGNELIRDIYYYFSHSSNLGWKHSYISDKKTYPFKFKSLDVCYITITKNPYSWLLSLYRNPYHQYYLEKLSFKDFLQTPWKTVKRENLPSVLDSPIELWNLKNSSYLQLNKFKSLNLISENLIQYPEETVELMSNHFAINKTSKTFKNYEQSTKDMLKNSLYYQDFYRNERWKDELTKDSVTIINKSLDIELMAYFGYEIIA